MARSCTTARHSGGVLRENGDQEWRTSERPANGPELEAPCMKAEVTDLAKVLVYALFSCELPADSSMFAALVKA